MNGRSIDDELEGLNSMELERMKVLTGYPVDVIKGVYDDVKKQLAGAKIQDFVPAVAYNLTLNSLRKLEYD